MKTRVIESIEQIPPADWNALAPANDPFALHGFLAALEASGSVGPGTGWYPAHVVLEDVSHRLIGALPLYVKTHSFGEYIFDFAWANGAARAGLRYFPKLVAMIPFTPATGTRLLVHADFRERGDAADIRRALLRAALALAKETDASSIHLLFANDDDRVAAEREGFFTRVTHQFHWINAGYSSFDDFLGAFRSETRKQIRRERRLADAHPLDVSSISGTEIDDDTWTQVERFYRATCEAHGSDAYLTREFFPEVKRRMPENILVVAARERSNGELVAASLSFERGSSLFGRYWGHREPTPLGDENSERPELDSLHFELCYHRLIERAIQRGYTRVEAGAQGMHKLKRGFMPARIFSAHHIENVTLRQAIESYVRSERLQVEREIAALAHHGPFKRDGTHE